MKKILLLLVLCVHIFVYSQSLQVTHNKDYNNSRLPLGYGTNHFGTSGSGIWTELQPRLPRVDYWRVYFVNRDTGLATGDMGAIIKTTDGGQNWYTIDNSFNTSIKAIGSFSGDKIIAAGDGGLIIKSTDLGESWEIVQSNTMENLWNIQFVTEQTGWIVGVNATALKTTDGGDSWTIQNLPLAYYTYYDVSFLDSLFGYISANGGYILRTKNGGISWDVTQVGDNYGLFTIKAVTRQKGVALGYAGKQVNTTDGGESWYFKTFLGSIFSDMAFIDTLKGYATGVGGSFETTDGGLNWEWRMDMPDENLGITFVNNEIGYVVGQNLINQKTTNAGENWQRMIINDDFTDVFFTDENDGWFIGNKKLFQTTDGGETLIERNDFPGNRPSSVYFIDSLTGIVGAMNKIYKTTDGGINWEEKNIDGVSGNAQEYMRLFFINNQTGWAVGIGGYIIKTTDNGENWQMQLNVSGPRGIHFSDTSNGWVVRSGKPLKTTNGGNTWVEQINFPVSNAWDVFFKDSLNGFISRTNEFYKTTNGGTNWTLVSDVANFLYGRFSNLTDNLFLAGVPRTYRSTNAGESWNEVMELRDESIRFIRLSKIDKGYAVGDNGLIIKYLDTTYTPVELASFYATIENTNRILLEWTTATEINNKGFVIQRSNGKNNWKKISFVNGAGNSTEIKRYKFLDKIEKPGKYYYRLKQVDYDGTFKYGNTISIEVAVPSEYKLNQNYPNPFNPNTKIEFEIPETAFIRLIIYNLLGEKVQELVNNKLEAGYYNYTFNGAQYSSGTYVYSLQSKNYIESRKMVLLK